MEEGYCVGLGEMVRQKLLFEFGVLWGGTQEELMRKGKEGI